MSGFYNRQGDFPKTIEALKKAADLEPKNPQGYQLVATYYWEKAHKDHRLSTAQKKDYILKGIDATDKALALNPDYVEALTYKNILLRMQGNLETDIKKRAAALQEADQLPQQAMDLNKKKATEPWPLGGLTHSAGARVCRFDRGGSGTSGNRGPAVCAAGASGGRSRNCRRAVRGLARGLAL